MLFTRIGVEPVSKIVVQGNILNLNHWRKKEENEQNHYGFLLIALHRMQIQHWNTRMNQVGGISRSEDHSCAEVVVRITDDSPSLN